MSESITEKIRKLLALAEGNQNENERAVAMKFAMDLLAKHNLTVTELQIAPTEASVTEVEHDFRLEPWVRRTLSAVCRLYYTAVYTSTRFDSWNHTVREIPVFVGTAENIEVTIEMATWLLNSIRLESNRAYKPASLRRSFRLGAANRLLRRAIEMVLEEEKEPATGTGSSLMVLRNHLERANRSYMDSLNLRTTRQRRLSVDRQAYEDGDAYGSQIKLERNSNGRTVRGQLPLHS